jgi:hypothetical protein
MVMMMSMITKSVGLLGRFPKFINIIFLFIACALITFLFLGCIDPSTTFSDVYLVEYQFNSNSSLVAGQLESENGTYSELIIRSGFLCKYSIEDI